MKVEFKTITPDAEKTIVEIARVSSSRKNKSEKVEGLINYLIKHKHFSPFEHGFMTIEIETSKAIGIQLIRHRSFTFQEFSQRYQDVNKVSDDMFEPVELRKQCDNNRQSSTEVFDPTLYHAEYQMKGSDKIRQYLQNVKNLYNDLLDAGVAREQARMILPLTTKSKIFMTGSIRSWIHFLEIRDDEHAQKEIQLIAKGIKRIFVEQLPIISKALGWETTDEIVTENKDEKTK